MTVKIVPNSVADLPPQVAQELEIMAIPLHVRFSIEVYRDGIELTADEFFDRLVSDKSVPVSSVPSPGDFVEVYENGYRRKLFDDPGSCNASSTGIEGVIKTNYGASRKRFR